MPHNSPLANEIRASLEHLAEQLARFIRLTLLAALPTVWNVLGGDKFDWRTLLAFLIPFAEVAFHQVWPSVPTRTEKSIFTKAAKKLKPSAPKLETKTVATPPEEPLVITGPADVVDDVAKAVKKTVAKKAAVAKKAPAKRAPAKKTAAKKTTKP